MPLIPKVIYQTWKTKNLEPKLEKIRDNIQKKNPDYKIVLFDDDDIEIWIKENFNDEIIWNTYKKLKIGAARADFWRYLILYKNGGIYLDIDSNITESLDLLIKENDSAIISREKNSGYSSFLQWCLMFSPEHPVLLRTINLCIYNINNKTSSWLPSLTGPLVFTNAINYILKNKIKMGKIINFYHFSDNKLNILSDNLIRFFGFDYENFCKYDNGCKNEILKDSIYWKNDKEIFN